jgi:glycosyltransferase involved in cell wall biosynthesis
MKVLHLIHNYHPSLGGSQHLFKCLSEELVETFGDDVTVMTTDALGEPSDPAIGHIERREETINGVRVLRFPYLRHGRMAIRVAARLARALRLRHADLLTLLHRGPLSVRMLEAVQSSDADVVCATSFGYAHMLYPLLRGRRGKRKPFVCYGAIHIVDDHVDALNLKIASNADAYVANTPFERETLARKGVAASKIHVVGPGVHPALYEAVSRSAARARWGMGEEPVIAYIGRQAAGKGIDTLLAAMSIVWERVPDATVLIAGAKESFSNGLSALVAALPPERRSRIRVIEDFEESEKPLLFAACDIFSMVSKYESFGITYLEAWASGKPVIGADIGAVRCVIEHGEDGILVPYGDARELSQAILRMLMDPNLMNDLGRSGHRKVQQHYTWTAVTKKLRGVYELVQRA